MSLFSDDGTAEVSIPVSSEMWAHLHQEGSDPVLEVQKRGCNALRLRHQYEEDEIELVSKDSMFQNSARVEYWSAKKRFDKHRKLPSKLTLTFNRPGTRRANNKEEKET